MKEIINALSERLEAQAVEIAKLKVALETQTERSSKLRKWWDDETDKTASLETQIAADQKQLNDLLNQQQSWEYERATLLGQVKDLESKLAGRTAQYEAAIE